MRCAIPLSAELSPDETREISAETTSAFQAERLVVLEVTRSRSEVVATYLRDLPVMVLENFLALFSDYHPCPGWRLPHYFPVEVVKLKVGTREQFRDACRIPAEIFSNTSLDPHLRFDVCGPGQRLTLTVHSVAKRPFTFRACFVGWT